VTLNSTSLHASPAPAPRVVEGYLNYVEHKWSILFAAESKRPD